MRWSRRTPRGALSYIPQFFKARSALCWAELFWGGGGAQGAEQGLVTQAGLKHPCCSQG